MGTQMAPIFTSMSAGVSGSGCTSSKSLYIPGKEFRFFRCLLTCVEQFIPHMTTEIFFCKFPSFQRITVVFLGIEIDASIQLLHQLLWGFPVRKDI